MRKRRNRKPVKVLRVDLDIREAGSSSWQVARMVIGNAIKSDFEGELVRLLCQSPFRPGSEVEIRFGGKDDQIIPGIVLQHQEIQVVSGVPALTEYGTRIEVSFSKADEGKKKAFIEFHQGFAGRIAA